MTSTKGVFQKARWVSPQDALNLKLEPFSFTCKKDNVEQGCEAGKYYFLCLSCLCAESAVWWFLCYKDPATPPQSYSARVQKEREQACWQHGDSTLYIWKPHQLSPLVSLSASFLPPHHQTSLSPLSFLFSSSVFGSVSSLCLELRVSVIPACFSCSPQPYILAPIYHDSNSNSVLWQPHCTGWFYVQPAYLIFPHMVVQFDTGNAYNSMGKQRHQKKEERAWFNVRLCQKILVNITKIFEINLRPALLC